MHTRLGPLAALATSVLLLAGCSSGGTTAASTTTNAMTGTPTAMTAQACLPVPGDSLVVLTDDKHLQNSDNVIPAVNAKTAGDPAVMAALDVVSAALDTSTLITLNKAVDIDRKTSAEVAAKFVADQKLTASKKGSGKLTVGAANFSENITIAEIYGAVLRTAGYDVTVRPIGNRETYMPALESGEVNVVPEYAATAAEFLNHKLNGDNAPSVATGDIAATSTALAGLGTKVGLVFGTASAAQDQNAFAVTTAFAAKYNVKSLADLAKNCAGIALGGPPECPQRTFCQPGLEKVYGINVTDFSALDAGGPLTKTAIRKGDIAVGLVFSSDGELAS